MPCASQGAAGVPCEQGLVLQTLRAFVCPCCGARLDPPTAAVVICAYCDARLLANPEQIVEEVAEQVGRRPGSRLRQLRHGRFEMSWLHQCLLEQERDLLHFEALGERFSVLIYLRLRDRQGLSQLGRLPLEPILESLKQHPDVGLAAHQGLEWLCQQPQGFPHQLECCLCLFDSQRARLHIYSAGCPDSLYWLCQEEGRVSALSGHREALERKMLLEARDHFSPEPPRALAAQDAVVFVSAAYCGRGEGPYASGASALYSQLQEQLGEEPLRLVTLAKNAFWNERPPAAREHLPGNSLHVVAVQARPNPAPEGWSAAPLQELHSRSFACCLWSGPEDFFELLPLHNQRAVLVWASNDGLAWDPQSAAQLRSAILEVLDRPDHGDNENPRLAGRQAAQHVSFNRLLVVQLLDRYRRVKYYRYGQPQPQYLAPRGVGSGSIMAFDEGGEVTLEPGSRLLFLPPHPEMFEDEPLTLADLAANWPGGKASNLYATLFKLWTTPASESALQKVVQAIAADGGRPGPGTLLVTSLAAL